MAVVVIAGYSGSGKSSSLRYLNPEETFIVNVNRKALAIPGFKKNYKPVEFVGLAGKDGKPLKNKNGSLVEVPKGNYFQSHDYKEIRRCIKAFTRLQGIKRKYKTFVIDDINYLMGQDVMSQALVASRDKYTVFAYNYNDILSRLMELDGTSCENVLIISHIMNEEGSEGKTITKMMSVSKMLDKVIYADGMFNYIIYAEKLTDDLNDDVKYVFRTRSNGNDTCRCTAGCFGEKYIESNAALLLDRITKFENGEVEPDYNLRQGLEQSPNKENVAEKKEEEAKNNSEEEPAYDDDI